MKIIAYMPVYNEADVLPFVLRHMTEQGIQVHALEGWSTDGSYEILRGFGPGVTVERFPGDGPDSIQECRQILARIEGLANHSNADWCYLSDADEFRRSPRCGETLADGIARVDAMGYNAIDHRVFAFFPTDDGWQGSPEAYFRHFNERDLICRLPNEKAWKNVGGVHLAGGGHILQFAGKRLCPERFVMKHYPYRTPQQAREKIQTRLARRCESEYRDGWGVHYDEFGPNSTYRWHASELQFWPDTTLPLPEAC